MKKFLLSFAAAIMVATGASAQKISSLNALRGYQPENLKLEKVAKKCDNLSITKNVAKKNAKRAEDASIEGVYILNAGNFDDDFTKSSMFSLYFEDGSINLDQYEDNPEFTYNVVLEDFTLAGATVYGLYEDGQILIPMQTIFTHSTYKEIVISGGYRSGESNLGYGKALILNVYDDGTMDVDEDIEDESDDATTGWVSFIPNYVDSETGEEGGLWDYGFDLAAMKPNATMSYETSGKLLGGTGSGWASVEKRVYVEDWGSEIVVSNFLGLCPISITINDDGTCEIPLPQDVDDYDYERYDNSYAYGRMRLLGVYSDEEGYIHIDYDAESLEGRALDSGFVFYSLRYNEEDGKYYYTSDIWPYICVGTAGDMSSEATYPYVMGYVFGMDIFYDEVEDAEGISTINANKTTGTKTFNLMGQQVTRNGKGLFIRNGKKFVRK